MKKMTISSHLILFKGSAGGGEGGEEKYMMGRDYHIVVVGMMVRAAVAVLMVTTAIVVSAAPPEVLPGCPHKCGHLKVPYPFGFTTGCYAPGFHINCIIFDVDDFYSNDRNVMYEERGVPIMGDNFEYISNIVLNISLNDGLMTWNQFITSNCYYKEGVKLLNRTTGYHPKNLTGQRYTFSNTRNMFVGIGCDTIALLHDDSNQVTTGCVSICNSLSHVTNGSCSGVGCCQTPIPMGLSSFKITLDSYKNHTNCLDFNPCSYGFLVDIHSFHFTAGTYFYWRAMMNSSIPVTLDWTIDDKNCSVAKRSPGFACVAGHSECLDSSNILGYRCICSKGFQGNPYLKDGCEDVNECESPQNLCVRRCRNEPGSYSCPCPWWMYGDGKINGKGCRSIFPYLGYILGAVIAASVAIGLLFPWVCRTIRSRKKRALRLKNFNQNHGLLMEKLVSSGEAFDGRIKTFSLDELEKATNNFDDTRVLGSGGHGTVYKGILSDQRIVAIKKSNLAVQDEIEQFTNEIVILSQLSHRNVVKLFGCCLETKVPLLVYEFITNGTLADHLRGRDGKPSLSWDDRLRIATEAAGALTYIQSAASITIFHRDVKSSNILLDDNCTVKVSDFGASRLILSDQKQVATRVQGTLGYIDPEYFRTQRLTHKSDVFSFGVILMELLTGQKPSVTFPGSYEEGNLTARFLTCLQENKLFLIVQQEIMSSWSTREEVQMVAMLAEVCLRLSGDERPSMNEVEQKLLGLRNQRVQQQENPWRNQLINRRSRSSLHELRGNYIDHGSRQSSLESDFMWSIQYPI